MELVKVYFCLCIYLVTIINGRPLEDEDMFPSLCWRLRGTSYKVCVEEDDDAMLEKRAPVTLLRQLFSYPLSSGKEATKNTPDFTYSSGRKMFPAKKDSSAETFIHKRPFDSISYNTGLGGFK